MKSIKRILTPLFFVVLCITVFSISAFADGVSGVPTVSINGASPVPFTSNLTFQSGDEVTFVSSGIISSNLTIRSGIHFIINPNVIISCSGISVLNNGILSNYGTIIRSGSSSNDGTIGVAGIFNSYFGSVVINDFGSAVFVVPNGIFNLYNGSISGVDYGVVFNSATGSSVDPVMNFYNGTVSGSSSPFSSDSFVFVSNGSLVINDNVATVKSNILGSISDLVSSSITWLNSFVSSISSSPFLLVFVLLGFALIAIPIIRRIIYL